MTKLPKIIRAEEPGYRQCTRTLMDTTDPDIRFNADGSSHWVNFVKEIQSNVWNPDGDPETFSKVVSQIRADGRGKKYDCMLGLSGGLDSSYLAAIAYEAGLRTLIFHTDTGWNTEIALNNIESIINRYNFPLYTHVIDWREMADVQRAFLRAGVPNQDIPQDHAIFAAFYAYAAKQGIKWVLNGSNYATESVLPKAWGYKAGDAYHLKRIHKRFGERPIGRFPLMGIFRYRAEFTILRGMKIAKLLNLLPYNRRSAMDRLTRETGWQFYGGKHFESRWTRFFQAYWLPKFFGYDKKIAHLSSLILSGQITKNEAMEERKIANYDQNIIEEDIEFIAKKLNLKNQEVQLLTNPKIKSHFEFPNSQRIINLLSKSRIFLKEILLK